MTFIEQLHSHVGGLVRLKAQIYWHDLCYYDRIEDRVCLLLDSTPGDDIRVQGEQIGECIPDDPLVLLLIDDSPKWVWISEDYVELIK
jgi:hypothetical protein